MPLIAHGFSFCLVRPLSLASAQGGRAGSCSHGPAFFICAFGLPRSAHPPALAAAHLSAPFSLPRQLKFSELVSSILAECRVFGNSSKITLRFRRNPSASRSRAFTLKTVRRQNLACVQMALISKPAFDLPVFTSKTIDKR